MIPKHISPVIDETTLLAELFRDAGFKLYLVGGMVRDVFRANDIQSRACSTLHDADFDFTTDATPTEVKRILHQHVDSLWTQGERFGTIGALYNGRQIEVTTHRAEHYAGNSRKPAVEFTTEIEQDLSRRDFTINAMAIELTGESPRLVDPFNGLDDLQNRVLATPVGAMESFTDDPLRMMRAARFVSIGFVATGEIRDAIVVLGDRLSIVSMERIRDELNKLIVTPDPAPGLWFLYDTDLCHYFLPELADMRLEQDPIHKHKDVLAHTIAVVCNTSPRLNLRLSALFHDIGKPQTRSVGDHGVSFHHHEVVGARMCRHRMAELRYPKDMIRDVSQLVYLHLRFHTYSMGWSDAAVRRFVRDGGDQLDDLIELTRSDVTTRNKRKAELLARRMDELEERIVEISKNEELSKIRPAINGKEVCEHLSIKPSRLVGEALEHLLQLRIEHGPISKEETYELLDEWYATRSDKPTPT